MKKKRKTGWIWFLILLLGAGAFYYYYYRPKKAAEAEAAQKTNYLSYTAAAETVSKTVTGSGLLESGEEKKLSTIGGLKILSVPVKEGDAVAAGDTLYTVDPDTLEERILTLTQEISSYSRQVMRASDSDAVYAPGSGRLKAVYAEAGKTCEETIREYGALAVISTDDTMALLLETANAPEPGRAVQVTYPYGSGTRTEKGTVERKTENGCLITLPDTYALPGDTATVFSGTEKLGEGTLYIPSPLYVYALGGTVKSVNTRVNSAVNTGSKLFLLVGAVQTDSYRQAVRDRDKAAEELETLLYYRGNPVITAPEAGIIGELCLKEYETTEKDKTVAVLHTGGAVKMTVEIDETDIPGIQVGQQAEITLDAYPDTVFTAEVTRIPAIGKLSGSITVYETELTLSEDARLMEGMHGSAVITTETRENVIALPTAVLEEDETGTYVLCGSAAAPEKKYVTCGISDGTVTEITGGIAEGDTILYTPRAGTDIVSKMMSMRESAMRSYGG